MYKKVLTCIYDTVFFNDFGYIKTNHICCNMTNELKGLLKIYSAHLVVMVTVHLYSGGWQHLFTIWSD